MSKKRRIWTWLTILGMLAAVGFGIPALAQDVPDGPTSCAVAVVDNQFEVTWPAVVGSTEYLVHRSVNDSPFYWRNRVSTLSYTDSFRSGNVVYRVTALGPDGARSEPTVCDGEAAVAAPTSCSVAVIGSQFEVSWPAVTGASEYIVRRSVNGSTFYWRGRVAATTFSDSIRSGSVIYTVTSLGANGTISAPTTCDSANPADPVQPPSSCSVLAGGSFEVSWPAAEGANEYVIERSVDGRRFWWRGRVSSTSFSDSFRSGDVIYRVISVGADGAKSAPTPCSTTMPPEPDPRYLAVGDMANCNLSADTDVGNLLDRLTGPIVGLGDYAYNDGSAEDFTDCFAPPFGRHADRFHPVAGNHDYYTTDALGFFGYFGAAAGDPAKGYFSETDDDWQLLYLNTNCDRTNDCDAVSTQYQWLAAELAAAPADRCRAVIMHHPRWSSWGVYADQAFLDPIFQLLSTHEIDIVLTGHAHHYERLVKLNADGVADPSGFVQFTVGTGGAQLRVPDSEDVLANSAALITSDYGVLALELNSGEYSWEFVSTSDAVLDSGTNACNN